MAELIFPPLVHEAPEPWRWPAPPFARWAHPPEEDEGPQPCTIEAPSGDAMEGQLVGFDPVAQRLQLRTRDGSPALTLPFTRFSRLVLAQPRHLVDGETREPIERLPIASREHEYRLDRAAPHAPFSGHTLGHAEGPEGAYLFHSLIAQHAVQRIFVPRHAYERSHFGVSVEDAAAEHWVGTPRELLEALAAQHQRAVLPIGQALLSLGMATPEQLLKAMAEPLGDMPLGERLVHTGVITQGDLYTAIAHKMGYPVVDLTRFPIDSKAVGKIPMRIAFSCLTVPLLLDGARLVIATDRPARLEELRDKNVLNELQPVAVIAPRAHLKLTLMRLARQHEMWSGSVMRSHGFFPNTAS